MINDFQTDADQFEELEALANQERIESERPHPNTAIRSYQRDRIEADRAADMAGENDDMPIVWTTMADLRWLR